MVQFGRSTILVFLYPFSEETLAHMYSAMTRIFTFSVFWYQWQINYTVDKRAEALGATVANVKFSATLWLP